MKREPVEPESIVSYMTRHRCLQHAQEGPMTEVITIQKPNPPEVVARMAPIVEAARAFIVSDAGSHEIALQRFKECRAAEKAIEEYFEPSRKAADAAKREILAARDGLVGPVAEARSLYDRAAKQFERDEQQRADEERRRLQEQARKDEEERQLLSAIEAEESGDVGTAEAILAAPVEPAAVTVAPRLASVDGVSSRETWSAVLHWSQCSIVGCTNDEHRSQGALELVRYVGSHPEWLSLLEIGRLIDSHPNLNRVAVSQRGALRIPGVRAVSTKGRAART
jgi:hypothetical protein